MASSLPIAIASALNDVEIANLDGQTDITSLINDYFKLCDDGCTSCESDSESNDEGEEELPEAERVRGDNNLDPVPENENPILCGETEVEDEVAELLENVATSYLFVNSDRNKEIKKITDFSCKCTQSQQGQCIKSLDPDTIYTVRLSMQEMTHYEKDLILLGKISASTVTTELTQKSKKVQQTVRQRPRTQWAVNGVKVCRIAFQFIHNISNMKLNEVMKWFKENGLTPRQKKSGGRREKNSLCHDDIVRVVTFIKNYAEDHAISLPGRVAGQKNFSVRLLPTNTTKNAVFHLYKDAMTMMGLRAVKKSSWYSLWRQLTPHIVITKPMSDLCWECQKNHADIYLGSNLPVVVKNAKLRKQMDHLDKVDRERALYKDMVISSKQVVCDIPDNNNIQLSENAPCSKDIAMHYSFDFAQQVHYPSNPFQPGPMYFKTARKCGLFGINCEAIPQQVNYLVDEGACESKGANAVISYLHHFLANYGLGECDLFLHCDNCTGQNKNNCMMWYLAWRVCTGLHRTVSLNFLIAGHTKFAPDWCFGLVKQKFRRTRVSCLNDIANVVTASTPSGCNKAQIVATEDGHVSVEIYDWQTFLKQYFKSIPSLLTYHHFYFDSLCKGVVKVREYCDSEAISLNLVNKTGTLPRVAADLPTVIPSPGLSLTRQWYLFDQIRDFCSFESRDVTCPLPLDPIPSESNNKRPATSSDDVVTNLAPAKRSKGRGGKK